MPDSLMSRAQGRSRFDRTKRRAVWAGLVALALALGFLPASASATTEDSATISGRVELPDGVEGKDIYVRAYVHRVPFGWWSMASSPLAADGSFTL